MDTYKYNFYNSYNKIDYSQYLFDDNNSVILNKKTKNNVKTSGKFKLSLGYCLACNKKLVPIGSNRGKGF